MNPGAGTEVTSRDVVTVTTQTAMIVLREVVREFQQVAADSRDNVHSSVVLRRAAEARPTGVLRTGTVSCQANGSGCEQRGATLERGQEGDERRTSEQHH